MKISAAERTANYVILIAFAIFALFPLVTVVVASLIAGSVLLAPSIVIGYAVKAADRADRDGTW